MNINFQLLNDEIFFLPKERNDLSFPIFLKNILTNYLDKLDDFEGNIGESIQKNKKMILSLTDSIINSIHLYYNGYPSRAFQSFSDGMKSIKDLLPTQKRNSSVATPYIHYYKARRSDGCRPYTKIEMQHIPFQERHKIATYRYSIPGYPCVFQGFFRNYIINRTRIHFKLVH